MGARRLPGGVTLGAGAGLIALVALASRSSAIATGSVALDLSPAITAIRVVAYVAMAVGTIVLPVAFVVARGRLRRRRAEGGLTRGKEVALEPVPWWARLLGLVTLLAVIAFEVAVMISFLLDLRRAAEAAGGAGSGTDGGFDPSAFGAPGDDFTSLTIALVIVIALVIGALAYAIRLRLRPDLRADAAGGDRRASTVEAVEVSLEALHGEPDPRRAVIAAYAAMERSLAGAGFGRRRSEAPLEYLRRVLAAPTHAADDLRTITLLYQHAKFSDHPVVEAMRSRAIDALDRIRAAAGGGA